MNYIQFALMWASTFNIFFFHIVQVGQFHHIMTINLLAIVTMLYFLWYCIFAYVNQTITFFSLCVHQELCGTL